MTEFDAKYDKLLDELGMALSLAARNMTPEQLSAFTTQWAAAMTGATNLPHPLLLSLLIGRGSWPDQFLTSITDAVLADGRSLESWGTGFDLKVYDPSGDPTTGGPILVNDPLAGVFHSAASYSPQWMVEYFTTGGESDVDLPEYAYQDGATADALTLQMNTRLKQLLIDRGLDEASSAWFGEAALTAGLWESQYSQQCTPYGFTESMAVVVEYWQRQSVIEDHKTWWDKNKHYVLGGVGMLLALATFATGGWPGWAVMSLAAADAAIMAWDSIEYFKDHDTVNGWIGIGFILVPVVIGGIAAGVRSTRWIRISQADIDALETSGQSIWKNGVEITPQMWTDYLANNPNTFPRFIRDDNGFYRTPLGFPVKTRIDEIRQLLPSGPRGGGNVCVADVEIMGLPDEFIAHSRINNRLDRGALNADGTDRGFSYLMDENQRQLTGYHKVDGYERFWDTEAKILEDVVSRTDRATTGSIVLYTEKGPCSSCQAIIDSFRDIRPNISLTTIYE